jgi:hypothetical protein
VPCFVLREGGSTGARSNLWTGGQAAREGGDPEPLDQPRRRSALWRASRVGLLGIEVHFVAGLDWIGIGWRAAGSASTK